MRSNCTYLVKIIYAIKIPNYKLYFVIGKLIFTSNDILNCYLKKKNQKN